MTRTKKRNSFNVSGCVLILIRELYRCCQADLSVLRRARFPRWKSLGFLSGCRMKLAQYCVSTVIGWCWVSYQPCDIRCVGVPPRPPFLQSWSYAMPPCSGCTLNLQLWKRYRSSHRILGTKMEKNMRPKILKTKLRFVWSLTGFVFSGIKFLRCHKQSSLQKGNK